MNKYWDSKYLDLLDRVREWEALEQGSYGKKRINGYINDGWYSLSEAQIEAKINKVQNDIKKYFYCPRCGKKYLINEAIIKRKIIRHSFDLGNAIMPGWMKIKASADSMYIRLCPDCAKRNDISNEELYRAYFFNALATKKEIEKNNAGCLAAIAYFITVASAACYLICLIIK